MRRSPKWGFSSFVFLAKYTYPFMKGVLYMKYIAKIIFSNSNLSGWKINLLEKEFIERREIAINILNPMYEKWNKEFAELYPGKNGYSSEYSRFINSKQKDAIDIANTKSIGRNLVKLYLSDIGDIFGVCGRWNTTMELCLIPE